MIKNTIKIIKSANKNNSSSSSFGKNIIKCNISNNSILSTTTTTKRNNSTLNHNINNNNPTLINQNPIGSTTTETITNNKLLNNSINLNSVNFTTVASNSSLLDSLNPQQHHLPFENDNNKNVTNPNSDKNNTGLDLDTSKLYVSKSTSELFFTFMILKVCSYSFISDNSQHFINFFEKLGLEKPMNFLIKYSIFKQFCAGETIKETEMFTEKLNKLGIGTILDYSVEDLAGSKEGFDSVADMICETIGIASKNPTYSFSCVKYTGLLSPVLLEKLNQIVASVNSNVSELPLDSFNSPLDFYLSTNKNDSIVKLSQDEIQQIKDFIHRTDKIFSLCHEKSVPILVDAEQSYFQIAIHHLTMAYSLKFNKNKPILYNTYQMYLVNGMDVLKQHMELSKKFGFKLGAKIVRGAYMHTERERSLKLHQDNPILPTIQDTHNSYNNALDYLLQEIKSDPNSIGVMIASHNENSVNLGIDLIKKYQIDPNNPNIQFGQLFGMADFLSFDLVAQKQRIFKYVPFGPVKEVLPYLIRRMHENKGFIGSNSDKELFYLKKEIKRRLLF